MRGQRSRHSLGATIIELMITIAIVAVLAMFATAKYQDYRERVRVAQAVADISAMSTRISQYILDNRSPPSSLTDVGFGSRLDPWGRAYRYLDLTTSKGKGKSRRDRALNPLNTDFDLYSVGKDGQTQTSVVPPVSRDDVIRARDGAFIGLVSDFDP